MAQWSRRFATFYSLLNRDHMPPTDAVRYSQIYRAITRGGWFDASLQRVASVAFALNFDRNETGISLVKEVGCSEDECVGGFRTCFGEFRMLTQSIIDLGLSVVDDNEDDPEYDANYAQITASHLVVKRPMS
jgi:hypothetical protein